MRCQCCNKNLSDYESTLRHPNTNEFLDVCVVCLKDIPIDPIEPDNMDNFSYDDTLLYDDMSSFVSLEPEDE